MKQIIIFIKIILQIIILFYFTKSSAQNAWDLNYNTETKDGPFSKVSIDSEGNYFISIYTSNEETDPLESKTTIIKVSNQGTILDSISFENTNIQYLLRKNIILNDTLYIFGKKKNLLNEVPTYLAKKYDVDFNFIDSNSYKLPDNISSVSSRDIIMIDGNIVILTTINVDTLDWPINGIGLLEFNRNLDSVNFSFNIVGFAMPFSIVNSYENDLIVPSIGWGFNSIDSIGGPTGFGFFSGESLLPIFTRRINSQFLHNGVSMKQYPDSNYIVSGEHHFFSTKNVGVFKISNDFEILDSIVISSSPISYPNTTYGQNLDFTDPNTIYFGSTENVQGSTASPFTNHIRITKLDSDLNVIWEKFYGGDANYFCYTLKATEDEGCIVLATRFDFLNDPDPNHLGTYILKLGPDGIITGIDDIAFEVKEVLVYPNPGRELKVATGFENYSLTLIDLNGKIVYTGQGLSRDSKHELSFLSGGMYIYRITSKNGELLDSGKWVKQ